MSVTGTIVDSFTARARQLDDAYRELVERRNAPELLDNGIYTRWQHPVLTRDHVPLDWRYDFDRDRNPHLMERLGINAIFNAGAIRLDGDIHLVLRVEGVDRKSFFAVASSSSGVDRFDFHPLPITMPETGERDTNVYDMRITRHEDGWIYGLFCTERQDRDSREIGAAVAQCGIARTRDLETWERLPDLETPSSQQRNVVLHPEFVGGQYGLYTRPQQGFLPGGPGIGWGLCDSMERAVVSEEIIVDERVYHTIKETKNGQGPAPLKSDAGWLHLAHGVRNTAAGLRYVLYMFATALAEPWRVTHRPGGHLIAPQGSERVGDVSNVVFSNGWVAGDDGEVHIYYASSDTRMHVATTTIDKLVDYVLNTPEDSGYSADSVAQRNALARGNAGWQREDRRRTE